MNNFDTCYSCINRKLFHPNYLQTFLKNKLYCKNPDKKIVKMVHRIVPHFCKYIDYEYFDKYLKIIKDLPCTIENSSENIFIFENYFYQEENSHDLYFKCNHCLQEYCPLHLRVSPLETYKCECGCGKKLELCNWCLHTFTLKNIFLIFHPENTNVNTSNDIDEMDLDELFYMPKTFSSTKLNELDDPMEF